MSYSQWANFVYYRLGDIAMYGSINYQALQPNINEVPTGLAPNWQVLPAPVGAGVSSLETLTGALTLSSSTASFNPSGNNIDVVITYPAQVPPQYSVYIEDIPNSFTGPLAPPAVVQVLAAPYTWNVDSDAIITLFYNAEATMATTGGNDLLIFNYTVSNSSGVLSSSIADARVYVDTQNKPTGVSLALPSKPFNLAGAPDTMTITISAFSAITGDTYTINSESVGATITRIV